MKRDISSKLAIDFYKKLGAENLASLTNEERDKDMLDFISKFLKKDDHILDLACGYGRITFLLHKQGYNVCGVDISKNLIKEAIKKAEKENLKIRFELGDMLEIPFPSEKFDKVICLWSSFNHLLRKEDQIKSINEMYRVLKDEGLAIIDLPNGETKWAKENIKRYGRVVPDTINGLEVKNYLHDRNSLKEICKESDFKNYKIYIAKIGNRERIIVLLKK
ncbi:MAG: hypothetical protein PWR30_371 [Candidatus Woesearchaeota archaeon]|nr:hypothetical protein [Candidatus Woesearchaeota archaeon]